jgi:hypothetical protein
MCALLGNYWAEMKSSAGTLTTHHCRSTSYCHLREHVYATIYLLENFVFLGLWERTDRACIVFKHTLHSCITPSLKNLIILTN